MSRFNLSGSLVSARSGNKPSFCAANAIGSVPSASRTRAKRALKPCPVVRGLDGAFGQFGDPLHLFAERLPPTRAGRQTRDGLKRAQHPQHDADIAFGAVSNLVERRSHQVGEGRSDGNDPQFPVLIAVR